MLGLQIKLRSVCAEKEEDSVTYNCSSHSGKMDVFPLPV